MSPATLDTHGLWPRCYPLEKQSLAKNYSAFHDRLLLLIICCVNPLNFFQPSYLQTSLVKVLFTSDVGRLGRQERATKLRILHTSLKQLTVGDCNTSLISRQPTVRRQFPAAATQSA